LVQLECGICGWLQDQPYPFWMHNIVSEYTWKLAVVDSQVRRKKISLWRSIHAHKETTAIHYPFSKTAGVLAYNSDLKYEHRYFRNSLDSLQNQGLRDLAGAVLDADADPSKILKYPIPVGSQEYPPKDSGEFITTAISPVYLNFTINLFSSHFSSNMKYIFPLMAYKQNLFNLDFRSTETWVVFSRILSNVPIPKPVGGVYWRLHKHKAHSYKQGVEKDWVAGGEEGPVRGVLEILFLAVWRQSRDEGFGGALVEKLKTVARENNCPVLYVEIGYETPQAKNFWGKNKFVQISDVTPSFGILQLGFIEHHCLRFNDTEQYVHILDAQTA